MKHSRIILIASFLAIIASIFTFSYFQKGSNEPQNTINTTVEPKDTAQIPETTPEELKILESDLDTSTWKTYRNDEFGFELKYPERILDVTVSKRADFIGSANFSKFIFSLKGTLQDGYIESPAGTFEVLFNNPDVFSVTLGSACIGGVDVGNLKTGKICALDGYIDDAKKEHKTLSTMINGRVCPNNSLAVYFGDTKIFKGGPYANMVRLSCFKEHADLLPIYQKMYKSLRFDSR